MKEIPTTEAEIRKEIFRREHSRYPITYTPLEEVLAMPSEELWKWWRVGTLAPISLMAIYFAQEPSLIRQLIQSFPTELTTNDIRLLLLSLSSEVNAAIEDYGLDPMWIDYLEQHLNWRKES